MVEATGIRRAVPWRKSGKAKDVVAPPWASVHARGFRRTAQELAGKHGTGHRSMVDAGAWEA